MLKLYENAVHVVVEATPGECDRLVEEFQFKPDGYCFAPTYERYLASKGKEGWDGFIRPVRRISSTGCKVLRGRLADILKWADENDYQVDTEKLLPTPFAHLTFDDIEADIIAGSFALDDHQRRCILGWLKNNVGIAQVTVSGGKCLGKGTPVMLASGKIKPVEQVVAGDQLMGPDSRPRRVLATGSGLDELYRVRQANGDSYVCNGDHILAVQTFKRRGNFYGQNKRYERESATIPVTEWLKLSKSAKLECLGYKVGVEFSSKKIGLDPYFLGLWLGDGSRHKIAVTTGDAEIVRFLKDFAERNWLTAKEEKQESNCSIWHLTSNRKIASPGSNSVMNCLRKLGLYCADEKWIPDVYKRNSRAVRMQLLAGLVDSDGYVKRLGQIEIASVYKRLADDICWLARSLGFSSSVRPKKTTCQTGAVGLAFRVRITGDLLDLPVLISRKRVGVCLRGGLRTRLNVEPIGRGRYYGFELDGDGLFLLGDFTVTHNTAMFAGAAGFIKRHYPNRAILYITPSERLVRQSTKELKKFLPGMDVGQFGGGHFQHGAKDIVVCTTAMLNKHYMALEAKNWFRRFIAVMFDECFVAGTLVGGHSIEKIKVGDLVLAFDEITRCTAYKPVTHCFKSHPKGLVKVTLETGKHVVCTLGHPFLTGTGWKRAIDLTKSDMVYTVKDASSVLQELRNNVPDQCAQSSSKSGLLFRSMLPGILSEAQFSDDGGHQPKICVSADEETQSDEESGLEAESYGQLASNQLEAKVTGWERTAYSSAAAKTGREVVASSGLRGSDWLLEGSTGLSDALPAGHCRTGIESGRGSGWWFASVAGSEETRFQTDEIFGEQRVDRVEILQPTSDGTFGGMCPDGFVYNLEVEGWHTYTANDCVVHNCHHAGSKSSQKILEATPAFFRFGASDTTKEDDERRWNDVRGLFGPVVNVVTAAPLMKAGRIAKPHIYVVDVAGWDNRFESVSYKPLGGSKAFVLVDDTWKVGKYLGPVYETDDEGNQVTKPVKTAVKDEHDKWIVEDKPVTMTGLHSIEIAGVEHQIPSKWCLLDRTYDRCIIQFRERNDAIVKWAAYYSNRGLPTVVVCTRTLHVYILEALLKKAVNPELVGILVGKDTSKARDECFDWFRKTPGSILITPLVKEGVSINEIRAGVIADYVADPEVGNQLVGRFIRQKLTGENRAEITWFRDRQHPVLRRGSNHVFQWLAQVEGYQFYDPAPADPARLNEQGELDLA